VKSQVWCRNVFVVCCALVLGSSFFARKAAAEKILAHDGDWTVFSDGRVGAFFSGVDGDGYPQHRDALGKDPNGATVVIGTITPRAGGNNEAATAQQSKPFTLDQFTQGQIERMRFRSGMIANTFGFGVRGPLTESTTVKGYIQLWAWVENVNEQKGQINYADVRQGYVKAEGPWGSVLLGRTRGLFSRAATDIDTMYGHGYGVGYPGSFDTAGGPTQGQIGFGLLGSGFASGVVYATPALNPAPWVTHLFGYPFEQRIQLTIGAFDPVQLQGAWPRTKWARPEAELTIEETIGQFAKVFAFINATYQRAYSTGDPGDGPDHTTAKGFTTGGRLELGPVHLGFSYLYGYSLGLNYALETSDAALDQTFHSRKTDGYYGQLQVSIKKVDVSASYGITQVFLTDFDKVPVASTKFASLNYYPMYFPTSVIKHQQGISCGAVYHIRPWLHFDVDLFRADFAWYEGEKQVIYVANSGMMFTW
jgi:hypothetical protein